MGTRFQGQCIRRGCLSVCDTQRLTSAPLNTGIGLADVIHRLDVQNDRYSVGCFQCVYPETQFTVSKYIPIQINSIMVGREANRVG